MPQPSLHLFQVFEEILKYKSEYKGRVVILKFGGNLVADNEVIENIARQTAMLRHNLDIKTVIVHGGGSQIDGELKRLRIPVKKDQATGLRITDKKTLFSENHLNTFFVNISYYIIGENRLVQMWRTPNGRV